MPKDRNLTLRGGTYYARLQVAGREVRRSLRTGDRRTAKQRLRELLEEAERTRAGLTPRQEARTWEDAVVRFADLHYPNLSPATVARYKVSLRALHPHLTGLPLARITQATFSAYAAARLRTGASVATVRRDLTVASLVMRAAIRAGWASENGALAEAGELRERRDPIRPVPLRRLALVLRRWDRISRPFADMVRFAARTGCRQEEAASLEWQQLDLAAGTCTFWRTKTNTPRTIPLTPATLRLLQRQERRPNVPCVFGPPRPGKDGTGRFENVSSRFRGVAAAAARQAGQDGAGGNSEAARASFRFHDLRHTYAIRWLQQGGAPWELSQRLGHASFATTEKHYALWMKRGAGTNPGSSGGDVPRKATR